MAIIGELIKRAIELSHTIISNPDPVSAQRDTLTKIGPYEKGLKQVN
jgi:hypothetical protein